MSGHMKKHPTKLVNVKIEGSAYKVPLSKLKPFLSVINGFKIEQDDSLAKRFKKNIEKYAYSGLMGHLSGS